MTTTLPTDLPELPDLPAGDPTDPALDPVPASDAGTEPAGGARAAASRERFFSRREAAVRCGCSPDHIRRAHERGDYPNAFQRPGDNAWMIPMSDLVTSGDLDLDAPPQSSPAATSRDADVVAKTASLEAENVLLTAEVEFLRRQCEALVGTLASLGSRS